MSWPISNQNGSTLVFKIVEALIPIASLFKPVFALYENQLKPKEIKRALFVDYLKGCALGDYLKFASFAKISDNQSLDSIQKPIKDNS